MKIGNREAIFGHQLGNVLATGNMALYDSAKIAPSVKAKKFISNILKIPDQNARDKILGEYMEVLCRRIDLPICKRLSKRLFKIIPKFNDDIVKKIREKVDELQSKLARDKPSVEKSYGDYPSEEAFIMELKERSNDCLHMKSIMQTINIDSMKNDTDLVKQLTAAKEKARKGHVTFAYLHNRIAKLNASKIYLDHNVNFVLSAHPRLSEISDHFLHALIKSKCSVWFSLNEPNEENIDLPFWYEKSVEAVQKINGWEINIRSNIEVIKDNKVATIPKLVKSIFYATKNGKTPREITHYHYTNWKDGSSAPSDFLLLKCTQIALQHLKDPMSFVGINCYAGIGRTGTLANIIYAAKIIEDQKNNGKQIDEISVNLANNNYVLKKQRPYLLGRHLSQYKQVHRVVQDFALTL